ncbi:integrase core domain protein [Trichonephila clavipes]|nr:integrase core domain protein [Trichonephila clavipes]
MLCLPVVEFVYATAEENRRGHSRINDRVELYTRSDYTRRNDCLASPREKYHKTDALGQKDNRSLVISSSSSLRLPKIQFQQFSGELTNWLRFHNQFKRINEDESIDDGVKFQHIIQTTTPKSRGRDIVESFPATPENYKKAFEYLRMRFGQDNVLIQVYVRELLKLVLQNTEVKKVKLSSLYDKIEAQLRALESFRVTREKYAAMLFPLVESCLPAEILRAWERYVVNSSDESDRVCKTESASIENSTTASSSSSNVLANKACTSKVLLQTLVVMLQNGNHKSLVRALIDTGSQKSYTWRTQRTIMDVVGVKISSLQDCVRG